MDGSGASFTSDEINFLIYRYMLENGFQHTAFVFGCESNIVNSAIDGTSVPRNALISIIQKGLHFTEAEFFAALASTSAIANESRVFESNLGSMGLLEAVLPDAERMKILEKKVVEELGDEACSRFPPSLRIVESQQQPMESGDLSESSSQTTSDVESEMEDENDENQNNDANQAAASTSGTLPSTMNLKEEPTYDNRGSILSHTNVAQYASSNPDSVGATASSHAGSGTYMNPASSAAPAASGSNADTNGMMSAAAAQFLDPMPGGGGGGGAMASKITAAVAPNIHHHHHQQQQHLQQQQQQQQHYQNRNSSYSPGGARQHFATPNNTNGSNNSPAAAQLGTNPAVTNASSSSAAAIMANFAAGHTGKLKASAALAATKPGMNGLSAHSGDTGAQLVSLNGKFLPNIPNLNVNLELDRKNVIMFKGHQLDVFICTWNPRQDLIASGSGDGTARIWRAPDSFSNFGPGHVETNCLILDHRAASRGAGENPQADVTSIDWNINGNLLATGCYDGVARVWDLNGNLLHTNNIHQGPIFALKWNYSGTRVLSAGVDNSTIVWNPANGEINRFNFHTSSALDVDWINDEVFASCSVDRRIHVCQMGLDRPFKTFIGHENEVNAVKFDRMTQRLASCSDDRTLKIWSLDRNEPIYDVKAHEKEIYTIRWSPRGNLIASASFDHSIKIWDVTRGECTYTLEKHTEPVYTVAFSPDGRCLASGSIDQTVNVWDLMTGKVVMTYSGTSSGIFEINWDQRGDRIAASSGDGTLLLFDVRFLKDTLHKI